MRCAILLLYRCRRCRLREHYKRGQLATAEQLYAVPGYLYPKTPKTPKNPKKGQKWPFWPKPQKGPKKGSFLGSKNGQKWSFLARHGLPQGPVFAFLYVIVTLFENLAQKRIKNQGASSLELFLGSLRRRVEKKGCFLAKTDYRRLYRGGGVFGPFWGFGQNGLFWPFLGFLGDYTQIRLSRSSYPSWPKWSKKQGHISSLSQIAFLGCYQSFPIWRKLTVMGGD